MARLDTIEVPSVWAQFNSPPALSEITRGGGGMGKRALFTWSVTGSSGDTAALDIVGDVGLSPASQMWTAEFIDAEDGLRILIDMQGTKLLLARSDQR